MTEIKYMQYKEFIAEYNLTMFSPFATKEEIQAVCDELEYRLKFADDNGVGKR